MKVSKQNDKLKNNNNGCEHFWNSFECFTNSLVHQTTHHDWVVGHNHGVAHLQWSTTNTQQRDGKHQSMNHKKKDKETKEWRVWLFFLLKTPLSTLQTLSWLSLHSLTTTPFPFFQWWLHGWKSQHKCDECVVFGKHLMVGVWMVLMSHNEPHHNHNTHHVCLPAFSLLVLSFHIHTHTNGAHVIVWPTPMT